MNKALLILCYTADTPHRTGSQETVRWLGSEPVRDTRRTGSQETVRWLGSEPVGDTRRTGSQETVRWLGSEPVGDTRRTGSQETVRWLGSGFTYYEKRIDYVRAEQPKKA